LAEGERVVACRYCGGQSLVLVPGGVPRYAIDVAIDAEKAGRIASARLQRPDVPQAVRTIARFDAVDLCFVPFYEATAVRLGTVFIRERVRPPAPPDEAELPGPELDRWLQDPGEEREDTKVVAQDVTRVGAACELPELGADRIRLADLRRSGTPLALAPFDPVALQGRGTVFAPTMPSERFLNETTWRLQSQHDATRYAETRLKLVYYPVWHLRYSYRGRAYEVAVDGVTGALLRGTAPRNRTVAVGLKAAGLAVAALGVGRWLRWMLWGGVAGPAFLLAAVAGAVLIWLGSRWAEAGGEIILEDQ
jgi:hypothetical protein